MIMLPGVRAEKQSLWLAFSLAKISMLNDRRAHAQVILVTQENFNLIIETEALANLFLSPGLSLGSLEF